jgi:hypothetical protein
MAKLKPSPKRKPAQAAKVEQPEPLPERIREIADTVLNQRATDAWRAVNVLLGCIRFWEDWVRQLRTTGDADPGHAWQCNKKVWQSATILIRLGVNSKSFRGATVGDILERFPQKTMGDLARPEIRLKNHIVPAVKAWQETYPMRQAEERNWELAPFEGELRSVRELLETAPGTVFLADPVTPAAPQQPAEAADGNGRKRKKSTSPGDAEAKLIAALLAYHKYENGSVGNPEPIGNNKLAKQADVVKATASKFFKDKFGSHRKYRVNCTDTVKLGILLKTLAGEWTPKELSQQRVEVQPDEND